MAVGRCLGKTAILISRPSMPAAYLPLFDPQNAGEELTAERLVDRLFEELAPLRGASHRPYLLLNMIASVDGRTTHEGRSGPLGGPADRELFHALRTLPDGILVGARTLRVERYNRLVPDLEGRRKRAQRGLDEEPYACLLTASGELDPGIPLLREAGARLIVLTTEGTTIQAAAPVTYIRNGPTSVDLAAAVPALAAEQGIGLLLCEGGPHTAGSLVALDLVDELLLTLSPRLTGGDIASSPAGSRGVEAAAQRAAEAALPLLSGPPLLPPRQLELAWVYRSDSFLFLRYRLRP